MENVDHQTLAWHETLELHELVAFQSIGLIKIKNGLKAIEDNALKIFIYRQLMSLK